MTKRNNNENDKDLLKSEPQNYEQAVAEFRWIEAMMDELKALKKNDTWKIVKAPLDKKLIGCKWTYKFKYNCKKK